MNKAYIELIMEYGETMKRAGQLLAAIEHNTAMLMAIKETEQPPDVVLYGSQKDSPGRVKVAEPAQPVDIPASVEVQSKFSKAKVKLPKIKPNGFMGTARNPIFDPGYRPIEGSNVWFLEQTLHKLGGRARRHAVESEMRKLTRLQGLQFTNSVNELRRHAVLKRHDEVEEGYLEFTEKYVLVVGKPSTVPLAASSAAPLDSFAIIRPTVAESQ